MNNTNKELEDITKDFHCINPICDQKGTIPHRVSEDEWEAEQCEYCYKVRFPLIEKFEQALTQAKEQGVQESTDTIATALGACKMGITKNKTTEEVLTELLKALTTQEDQLIVKE